MSMGCLKKTLAAGLFSFTLLISGIGFCDDAAFINISAQDLKRLLDTNATVLLLNPLPKLMFRQGSIPGSTNIRWHSMEGSPLLPENKETIIVTYCMGPR